MITVKTILNSIPHHLRQNLLLAALPTAEFERLSAHLELIEMPQGLVLYESGGQLKHVYFPTTCIVSMMYVLENGSSAEIAVVGNEGILGISLFMGGETPLVAPSYRAKALLIVCQPLY